MRPFSSFCNSSELCIIHLEVACDCIDHLLAGCQLNRAYLVAKRVAVGDGMVHFEDTAAEDVEVHLADGLLALVGVVIAVGA